MSKGRVARPVRSIEKWLHAKGCMWSPSVAYSTVGVAAGYGLVARRSIKKGEVLFVVPRKAAFGASGAAGRGGRS